jgi:hypothetical protein
MQLLAPDILSEARGLSAGPCIAGLVLGMALWALGWRWHRFWIVLATTVLAGVLGLATGLSAGVHPLVVALLLAVAAGLLALQLVRVVAFLAGGLAAWLAVHALLPSLDEPILCFLGGGLVGLVLFRHSTMALTSLLGALIMGHSGLLLADRLGKLDAVTWTAGHAVVLNWCCAGVSLVGWLVQFLGEHWRLQAERARREAEAKAKAKAKEKEKKEKEKEKEKEKTPPPRKTWWNWSDLLRQAG